MRKHPAHPLIRCLLHLDQGVRPHRPDLIDCPDKEIRIDIQLRDPLVPRTSGTGTAAASSRSRSKFSSGVRLLA